MQALTRARDRLYDTDLFRIVTLDGTPRRAERRSAAAAGCIDATVTVELMPKYRLRYGFQLFDPYKPSIAPKWGSVDPGVVADLTRRGLFGRGLTAGISARVNPTDRVVRGIPEQPRVPRQAGADQPVHRRRVGLAPSKGRSRSRKSTRDLTSEQRLRFRRLGLQFSYGYNFQRLNQDLLDRTARHPGSDSVQA